MFCGKHLGAPSGTRGGWISAWRRARARGGGHQPLDASAVARRLWVGSKPPLDRDLPEFDTLFLCAAEVQPIVLGFGRQVIRVPIPDSTLSPYELKRALIGGTQVAEALRARRRVLVTCYAGRNRSALVASLGLLQVTRMAPTQLVKLMRERRHPAALDNPHFVEILQRVYAKRAL